MTWSEGIMNKKLYHKVKVNFFGCLTHCTNLINARNVEHIETHLNFTQQNICLKLV